MTFSDNDLICIKYICNNSNIGISTDDFIQWSNTANKLNMNITKNIIYDISDEEYKFNNSYTSILLLQLKHIILF